MTVRALLAEGRRALAHGADGAGRREAALLLGHLLGWSEAEVVARDDREVDPAVALSYAALCARRAAGEPVAYLTGRKEFYGRLFRVDARVLVPRPESEHLVETALALDLPPSPRILDLGTGSGCLAVTLAAERPAARVVASDLALGALAVARGNAGRLGVAARVALLCSDLAAGMQPGSFDLVVSNPPYLDPEERHALPRDVVGHEPAVALFGGTGGLELWRRLVAAAAVSLRPGGFLVGEIGRGQVEAVCAAAAGRGLAFLRAVPDLAGIPRVVVLRRGE